MSTQVAIVLLFIGYLVGFTTGALLVYSVVNEKLNNIKGL